MWYLLIIVPFWLFSLSLAWDLGRKKLFQGQSLHVKLKVPSTNHYASGEVVSEYFEVKVRSSSGPLPNGLIQSIYEDLADGSGLRNQNHGGNGN